MPLELAIFWIAVLIFSVIVHEVMHGVAAEKLGDPTARLEGRITLNPLPHIDLFGSIILPAALVLTGSSFVIGWAKPVPYNPYNFRRGGKWGEAIVAGVGPASNLALALLCGLLLRLGVFSGLSEILIIFVFVNTILFLFNLIPIPPLDGSKVLEALLPRSVQYGYSAWRARMEMNPLFGMGLIVLFILLFGGVFFSFVRVLASLLAGLS